jgi:hypothetical protein
MVAEEMFEELVCACFEVRGGEGRGGEGERGGEGSDQREGRQGERREGARGRYFMPRLLRGLGCSDQPLLCIAAAACVHPATPVAT